MNMLPTRALQLMAALAGTYFYIKVNSTKSTRNLVLFLWLVVIIEVLGLYTTIGYYSKYRYLSFIEHSFLVSNYWLYNPFIILSFVFYTWYFREHISDKRWRQVLKYLILIYTFLSTLNLIFSDVFLNGYSHFSTIAGTLLLILSITIFYFELLKSDVLLNLKHFLPLYISVGTLIFYLCITPVDIFSRYFKLGNYFFVYFRLNIYFYMNIFLYSTYILGFIICSRKKKSY
jgi:hypothetical protein